jgi:hypothetical protein
MYLSDLHRTLLKSGRQLFAAFQELCKSGKCTVLTNRKKGINFKREWCMHSLSSKSFVNSKAFGVKWLRTNKFNIILKGELIKILNSWRTIS